MYIIKVPESYLLSNRLGSFYLWSEKPYSKYCGLFFKINNELLKCIEQIKVDSPLKKTNHTDIGILNQRKELLESFYLEEDENAFAYNLSHPVDTTLILDIRKTEETGDLTKNYTFSKEKGCILIKCSKRKNKDSPGYEYYIAVKSLNTDFIKINKYSKVEYEYDKSRKEASKRYVYKAFKLYTSLFTLAMSENKKIALRQAIDLYKHYKKIRGKDSRSKIKAQSKFAPDEINEAYKLANISLNKHITSEGIYSGYPFSTEIHTRDELMSLSCIIKREQFPQLKQIFSKYFSHQSYCGRLPKILPDKGKTADSSGWLLIRFYEYLVTLEANKELGNYYKKNEIKEALEFFDKMLFFIKRYHYRNGLIYSADSETWSTDREGYCIEIQTIILRMLKILYDLTAEPQYKLDEKELKEAVLKNFFKKNKLVDRLTKELKEDKKIRANVFIAYYIYPELLEKEQWKKVFDKTLKSLWDKTEGLSVDKHSWHYLNCITAICLYKLDKNKYLKYIESIIKISYTEILSNGIIGSLSESNNKNLSYAPALASFIELIDLVYE